MDKLWHSLSTIICLLNKPIYKNNDLWCQSKKRESEIIFKTPQMNLKVLNGDKLYLNILNFLMLILTEFDTVSLLCLLIDEWFRILYTTVICKQKRNIWQPRSFDAFAKSKKSNKNDHNICCTALMHWMINSKTTFQWSF